MHFLHPVSRGAVKEEQFVATLYRSLTTKRTRSKTYDLVWLQIETLHSIAMTAATQQKTSAF